QALPGLDDRLDLVEFYNVRLDIFNQFGIKRVRDLRGCHLLQILNAPVVVIGRHLSEVSGNILFFLLERQIFLDGFDRTFGKRVVDDIESAADEIDTQSTAGSRVFLDELLDDLFAFIKLLDLLKIVRQFRESAAVCPRLCQNLTDALDTKQRGQFGIPFVNVV